MSDAHFSLALVSAPSLEPISIEEAKLRLRVTATDEDDLITSLIVAVRRHAESYLSRRLIRSTWDLKLDAFPCEDSDAIRIPYAPLSSVVSITYIDEDGDTQTWTSTEYIVDTSSEPGRITPAYEESWPTDVQCRINAITVKHVVGYGANPSDVPASIIAGMKLMLSHLYEHREPIVVGSIVTEVPFTVKALWDAHRLYSFA
jgi:uncharacterized phiE125 gp8 family phage protein